MLNDLGLALMTDGRVEEAVGYYERAIRINPNFVAARLNLANAYFVQQKFDASSAQLQTVVKIDPRNFEAYMNAGVMLAQLKDFATSERMLKAAVILKGDYCRGTQQPWNCPGSPAVLYRGGGPL